MGFHEDFQPLVTGPWLRALSLWISINVFAFALITRLYLFKFIIFGLVFFAAVLDIFLIVHRGRRQKVARSQDQKYVFRSSIWVIVLDFVFGVVFLGFFGVCAAFGEYHIDALFYRRYNFFGAFTMVGVLALAHIHIFLSGFELHMRRQLAQSKRASARMQLRERIGEDVVQQTA